MYPSRKAAGRLLARGGAALALAATVLLAGCHNFFVCQKASCPSSGGGGGGGSTSTDYVYVSNATAGPTYVSGYDIGNGSLAAIGSPVNLNYIPVAMTVSPNDAILYIASSAGIANPGIYVYSINASTGQLSGPNGGQVQVSAAISSMDVSPDGKFLFSVDTTGTILTEYTIDSNGNLARAGTFGLPGIGCALGGTVLSQTCTVKVAPSGAFVLASLGSAGTAIYPYSSSSGITTTTSVVIPSGSTQASPSGDYSVTLDSSNFVYIARTNALAVYSLDSSGNYTPRGSQANSGTPRSVVLSSNQGYVYTANEGSGNISAYVISNSGGLTPLSNSPFSGPPNVSALGVDKSGTYMVAAGYNGSSGVQLFTIGSAGALTLVTSAGTGSSTSVPAILAMTH